MLQRNTEKPRRQAARHKRATHDNPPDEVEEFDTMIQNARMKLEFPVEPSMPCVTRIHIPTAKTQTQRVASKVGGRRPPAALSEGRLCLTRRERLCKAFESQRCILHKGRNHSHKDHVADGRFHSRHHCNLVHTFVLFSKAMNDPAAKITFDKDWEESKQLRQR